MRRCQTLEQVNLAPLAALIQSETDMTRRAWLEDRYWALAGSLHGEQKARWYRQESEWLRARGW